MNSVMLKMSMLLNEGVFRFERICGASDNSFERERERERERETDNK